MGGELNLILSSGNMWGTSTRSDRLKYFILNKNEYVGVITRVGPILLRFNPREILIVGKGQLGMIVYKQVKIGQILEYNIRYDYSRCII